MSLLTTNQKNSIRDAIKTVTDTFYDTDVVIHHAQKGLKRFNEGQSPSYVDYEIKGFAEDFSNITDRTHVEGPAQYDDSTIQVSLNYTDVEEAGLSDGNNRTVISSSGDYMTVNGVKYKIAQEILDGPLEAKNLLVILIGEREKEEN